MLNEIPKFEIVGVIDKSTLTEDITILLKYNDEYAKYPDYLKQVAEVLREDFKPAKIILLPQSLDVEKGA